MVPCDQHSLDEQVAVSLSTFLSHHLLPSALPHLLAAFQPRQVQLLMLLLLLLLYMVKMSWQRLQTPPKELSQDDAGSPDGSSTVLPVLSSQPRWKARKLRIGVLHAHLRKRMLQPERGAGSLQTRLQHALLQGLSGKHPRILHESERRLRCLSRHGRREPQRGMTWAGPASSGLAGTVAMKSQISRSRTARKRLQNQRRNLRHLRQHQQQSGFPALDKRRRFLTSGRTDGLFCHFQMCQRNRWLVTRSWAGQACFTLRLTVVSRGVAALTAALHAVEASSSLRPLRWRDRKSVV